MLNGFHVLTMGFLECVYLKAKESSENKYAKPNFEDDPEGFVHFMLFIQTAEILSWP